MAKKLTFDSAQSLKIGGITVSATGAEVSDHFLCKDQKFSRVALSIYVGAEKNRYDEPYRIDNMGAGATRTVNGNAHTIVSGTHYDDLITASAKLDDDGALLQALIDMGYLNTGTIA